MSFPISKIDCFSYEDLENLQECFTMPYVDDQNRPGYRSHAPANYPETILIPLDECKMMLELYCGGNRRFTTNLRLFVEMAVESFQNNDHRLNISVLRHELSQGPITGSDFDEIDLLCTAVHKVYDILWQNFNDYGLFIGGRLVYDFSRLYTSDVLVMTKTKYHVDRPNFAVQHILAEPAAVSESLQKVA